MAGERLDRRYPIQAITLVVVSTLVLTAAFVGMLAISRGHVDGVGGRFPWYVLAMGIAFVSSILLFVQQEAEPKTVLVGSGGLAVLTLTFTLLCSEGVVYAITSPEQVFGSHLVVYLLTAGLIATGLTIWLVEYWRTFTRDDLQL
ncbi:MAG: hypothetical protein ACOCY1_03820 [Halovenus sp.]